MKPYPFASHRGNLSIYSRGIVIGESLWGDELVALWDMLEAEGTAAMAEHRFSDGDWSISLNSHATPPDPHFPGRQYISRLAFDFTPNGYAAKVFLDRTQIGTLTQTKQPGYMTKYWPRLMDGREIFNRQNGRGFESLNEVGIALAMRSWP